MNTQRLTALLTRLPRTANFLGVFARDEIPSITFPCCFVVNTDISCGIGEHWVAVWCEGRSGKIEFFDSLAKGASHYGIPIAPHVSNCIRLQSSVSSVCGQYCVYFLYLRSLSKSMHEIVGGFSSWDFDWNDYQVAKWVGKLVGKSRVHGLAG